MDIILFIKIGRNPQLFGPCTDAADCRLSGLLHHISQRTGQLYLSGSLQNSRLDGQQLTAHACPRQAVDKTNLILLLQFLLFKALRAEKILQHTGCNGNFNLGILHNTLGTFPAYGSDLPLQRSHACLTRISVDQCVQGIGRDFQILRRDPVFLQLLRDQMARSNLIFFLMRIAAQGNDIHTIQQRSGNSAVIIGRCQEQNFAEIKGHINIMIIKCGILLRIENLQQRGGRIAAIAAPQLVHLVKQNQRVFHLRLP